VKSGFHFRAFYEWSCSSYIIFLSQYPSAHNWKLKNIFAHCYAAGRCDENVGCVSSNRWVLITNAIQKEELINTESFKDQKYHWNMLGVLPWQSIFTFCDQRIILYVMFGAIFLVQSNLCEALLVWVQQCLLQVKAMNMYPFSFSFMVQFMALIISTVTSYIRMMNKMEMLRNESVMYQLIYHVC
jgi:hypothetical protein